MAQNMYRVGDYVYFEVYPSSPYQIRRIEELNKTIHGTVEAKVICFYRRRDLPQSLLKIADQAERQNQILSRPKRSLLSRSTLASTSNGGDIKSEVKENGVDSAIDGVKTPENGESVTEKDKEDIKPDVKNERSLSTDRNFASYADSWKCAVVILNEVETCDMYLEREDAFFYSLVYDPGNHTLLADKGKIEMGERHQADIPDILAEANCSSSVQEECEDNKENGELMLSNEWRASNSAGYGQGISCLSPHHSLTDRDIDQFLIIARAVGTFSRALDSSSTMKLPSLHMTASAASRDVTLLHAMALLHQAHYDIGQATNKVTCHNTVSLGGPILCRDQLEEWSASEATLFEDALEKYGKDFHDIRVDCLPWKSIRDIVEYYYMWKTTARYTDMQKSKVAEQENKLKQVYIPSYNKANPNLVGPQNHTQELFKSALACESCKVDESTQWYAWGPPHIQLRLCNNCWVVWKKRGGLKSAHEYESYDLDGATDMNQAGGRLGANAANRAAQSVAAKGTSSSSSRGAAGQSIPSKTPQQTSMNPVMFGGKSNRVTFYLNTTLQARIARRMADKKVLNVKKADYDKNLNEVLRVARLVKNSPMSAFAIKYLTELHNKHALTNGSPCNYMVTGQPASIGTTVGNRR
uniref:Metastasis-associated protein MTA3 n=1 Tax=Ditylenchus dipsaci TaxID=166011 RepID=A0A915E0Z0_9BILA